MVKVKVIKVIGPLEVVPEPEGKPVKLWNVVFTYGETTESGVWQREGTVEVIDPITMQKVIDAVKAVLKAAKPHPFDGVEFEV